ncbi:hypothetical protein AAAX09_10045, partial [Bifidobacterium longum]|uniref:hypothetical protein n=1 Tax=Bifidobacterium longum TaxID=216816 RepID=UPI0032BFEA57
RHRGKPSAHTAEKHCRTCRTNIEAKQPLPEPPQAASGTINAAAAMPARVRVSLLKDTVFASFSIYPLNYERRWRTVRLLGFALLAPLPGAGNTAKAFSQYKRTWKFLQKRFRIFAFFLTSNGFETVIRL